MPPVLPPPRLRLPEPDKLSPEQRRIHDEIASGPRGKVQGPLAIWLTSPDLADKAQQLGAFCRYGSSLEPRLSELAILVTGRVWGAQFEWTVHKPIALKAGLSEAVVEAVRTRRTPPFEKEDERVVHDFAQTLHRDRKVTDELYAEAVTLLGERGVVDLVGILGYYTLISMTLNAFNVPLEGDAQPELD
ncbi:MULTISPECIES: carboxymuconolactone decarboxylase family protein [Thalassobaculum]|uniref:4-carboxymuconolactone decarboxylase n=1 Tax=Thalassobaculum litoreum DSM 18839 TaxID=1123362 RepID=A0A8G2BJH1_9PROT|nr:MULTISPECIES: carboxymuconolactone decarboxylase family protein [Thalassobaculum]SDG05029.1 4-carboxymuconolactone decarboxylase [Thalassobaculum litoreum DSM 18839]